MGFQVSKVLRNLHRLKKQTQLRHTVGKNKNGGVAKAFSTNEAQGGTEEVWLLHISTGTDLNLNCSLS